MKSKLVVALLLLIPLAASAAIDTVWSRFWTGAGRHDDVIASVATDFGGNVYCTGVGWDSTVNSYSFVTAKFDTWGRQAWRSFYPAATQDSFVGICLDGNRDVYIVGTSIVTGQSREITTVKYSGATGSQVWARSYHAQSGPTFDDLAAGIVYDSVNNALYVCGTSWNLARDYDYATLRYNPADGTQVWANLWHWTAGGINAGDDIATGICIGRDRDPVVTGYSYDDNQGFADWQTIRLKRTTGDTVYGWDRFGYGRVNRDAGNDDEWALGLCSDPRGDIYVTGFTYSNPLGYYGFMVSHHRGANGDTVKLPRRLFPGDDASWGTGIAAVGGRVITFGQAYDVADEIELSAEDWAILCYDTSRVFALQWEKYVDGGYLGCDQTMAMAFDELRRPYITGGIEDSNTGYSKWLTMRLDTSDGSTTGQWRYIPAPPFPDTIPHDTVDNMAFSIAIKDTNHIYIGGYINRWNQSGGGWDQDQALVRYGRWGPSVVLDSVVPRADSVDSGSTASWRAFYHNNGSGDGAVPSRPVFYLTVGTAFADTARDTTGTFPGQTGVVTFARTWTAVERGVNALKCTLSLGGDTSPANNLIARNIFVRVRDVGPIAVVNPPDTVGRGPLTPQATLRNHGNLEATFTARFIVGSETASATVSALAPGNSRVVSFTPNLNPPLGTHPIKVYSQLAPDMRRSNDTLTRQVVVIDRDVACRRIAGPSGTVAESTQVTPAAWVKNLGNSAVTFKTYFKIDNGLDGKAPAAAVVEPTTIVRRPSSGAMATSAVETREASSIPQSAIRNPQSAITDAIVYLDSVTTTLQPSGTPGDSFLLFFTAWRAWPRGNYTAICSTGLGGDGNRANDTARRAFTVAGHDAAALAIIAPRGTVDSGTVVMPRAVVQNVGPFTETFDVRFYIAPAFMSTVTVTLAPGASDTADFTSWTAAPVGVLVTRCSTMLARDINPANNRVTDTVRVLPGSGIEEKPLSLPDRFSFDGARPNPFSSATGIRYSLARETNIRLGVYDVTGKLVLTLTDTRRPAGHYEDRLTDARLQRGIYILRFDAGEYHAVRKLIVE